MAKVTTTRERRKKFIFKVCAGMESCMATFFIVEPVAPQRSRCCKLSKVVWTHRWRQFICLSNRVCSGDGQQVVASGTRGNPGSEEAALAAEEARREEVQICTPGNK